MRMREYVRSHDKDVDVELAVLQLGFKMGVLGKISGKTLVHFGAIILMGTILLCYAIAVGEGHVKAWLPTISACGEHPPEQYFFRYGILTGGLLLVVLALYIYTADFPFSQDSINRDMGVVAGLCLGGVAVCAANEADLAHLTFAVIFFVLEDILLVRITLQGHGFLSNLSFTIKAVCTLLTLLSSIGRLMVLFHSMPETIHIWIDLPLLPMFEWTNTLAIMAFHWSFAYDFSPLYFLAAWKDSSLTTSDAKLQLSHNVYKK